MIHSVSSPLAAFVNRLNRRSQLTQQEQGAILGIPFVKEHFQIHRDIVGLGERVTCASYIERGMVGRFEQNADGQRQITAIYVPGDMANLQTLVDPCASAALQALSNVTVLRISHIALREVVRDYPALLGAFWRDCIIDAALLSEWVANIGRRHARARLAHLMCEMAVRLGAKSGDSFAFHFPLTQQQLADATGLTSVHINRVAKDLREDSLVEIGHGWVRVLNWKRLVKIADFSEEYPLSDIPQTTADRSLAA